MSSNHRLSFSLDTHEAGLFLAFECDTRRAFEYDTRRDGTRGEKQVQNNHYCRMVKRARSSLGRFVKHLRSNLSSVQQQQQRQQSIPADGRPLAPSRHSVSLTHQQRCTQFGDSHQSEAIEDCINFLKNSSRKEVLNSSCQLQHLPHNLQK